MIRMDFPSEEEQFLIYQKLVQEMKGHEITFRTLDIGGDKVLSYFEEHAKEQNPFLGMRSIRFSLKHPCAKKRLRQHRSVLATVKVQIREPCRFLPVLTFSPRAQ